MESKFAVPKNDFATIDSYAFFFLCDRTIY